MSVNDQKETHPSAMEVTGVGDSSILRAILQDKMFQCPHRGAAGFCLNCLSTSMRNCKMRMKTKSRIDIIGQNGGDGEHYKDTPVKSDGSTASYYELPDHAKELQDIISYKDMNSQMGEIFRACMRYGEVEHSNKLRDIKKIVFYAKAEQKRLEEHGN